MRRGRIRISIGAARLTYPVSIIAASTVALLLTGCAEKEQEEPPPVVRPVKILTLGDIGSSNQLQYPGVVAATQDATMAFEVSGRVISFPVNEGQQVNKRTVLARLDPKDYQAARDREAANRNAARAEFNRVRELYETNVVSLREFDKARRDFEVTEANLRTADKALDDTYLRASFNGLVARKLVQEFENVQAKQGILILQDTSGLEVQVDVPESDWARARRNLDQGENLRKANPMVTVTTFPDRQFPARLKELATTADPVTRTYRITLAFDPPDDIVILPGMTARITATVVGVAETAAYTIPASAVLGSDDGEPYVWKVETDSDSVTRTDVEIGQMHGSDIEIIAGLEAGDRVAVTGVQNLREGMQVRPLAD